MTPTASDVTISARQAVRTQRRLTGGAIALAAMLSFATARSQTQRPNSAAIPTATEFHAAIHDVIESYPTDGTHRYHWPKKGRWAGVTRDLYLGEQRIAKGDARGRCYCCGLTFEVFWRAWSRWAAEREQPLAIPGIESVADATRLRQRWFGAHGDRSTVVGAVQAQEIGRRITHWPDVQTGDFVQLWRRQGSGHSVVFVDWVYRDGKIDGLRYWSTQKSTRGIGERVERFAEPNARGVDPTQLHVARVGSASPEDRLRVLIVRSTATEHENHELAPAQVAAIIHQAEADVAIWRGVPLPEFGNLDSDGQAPAERDLASRKHTEHTVIWRTARVARPDIGANAKLRIAMPTAAAPGRFAIRLSFGPRPAGHSPIRLTKADGKVDRTAPKISVRHQASADGVTPRGGRAGSSALARFPHLEAWSIDWPLSN